MSVPPEQFARLPAHLNWETLQASLVVVVGIGTVGSLLANEFAVAGVGHMRLIDGSNLKRENVARHLLLKQDIGHNKAEQVALFIDREVDTVEITALARNIDSSMSDDELTKLLGDANLVVIATDQRAAQRRVARQALSLDLPAIVPGLYRDGGGEVFVQIGSGHPCFFCWDGFRPDDEQLRAVAGFAADAGAVRQSAFELGMALLDTEATYARRLAPARIGAPHPQLFTILVEGSLSESSGEIERRPNCEACAVGPPGEVEAPHLEVSRRVDNSNSLPRPETRREMPSSGNMPPANVRVRSGTEGWQRYWFTGLSLGVVSIVYWAVLQPAWQPHWHPSDPIADKPGDYLLGIGLHLLGYALVGLAMWCLWRAYDEYV